MWSRIERWGWTVFCRGQWSCGGSFQVLRNRVLRLCAPSAHKVCSSRVSRCPYVRVCTCHELNTEGGGEEKHQPETTPKVWMPWRHLRQIRGHCRRDLSKASCFLSWNAHHIKGLENFQPYQHLRLFFSKNKKKGKRDTAKRWCILQKLSFTLPSLRKKRTSAADLSHKFWAIFRTKYFFTQFGKIRASFPFKDQTSKASPLCLVFSLLCNSKTTEDSSPLNEMETEWKTVLVFHRAFLIHLSQVSKSNTRADPGRGQAPLPPRYFQNHTVFRQF